MLFSTLALVFMCLVVLMRQSMFTLMRLVCFICKVWVIFAGVYKRLSFPYLEAESRRQHLYPVTHSRNMFCVCVCVSWFCWSRRGARHRGQTLLLVFIIPRSHKFAQCERVAPCLSGCGSLSIVALWLLFNMHVVIDQSHWSQVGS